jgi:hypothetical protein
MLCNTWYPRLNGPVEKIEVLSRLAPVLESDEQQAYTLAVLLEVVADYTSQIRRVLNELAPLKARKGRAAMRNRTALDDSLDALRQAFADLGLVLGIVADFRRRSDRMKSLILNELRELRPKIELAITLLSADHEGGGDEPDRTARVRP